MEVITHSGTYTLPKDAEQFVADFTITSLALSRFNKGVIDVETRKYVEVTLERVRFLHKNLAKKRLADRPNGIARKLLVSTGESVEQLKAIMESLISVLKRSLEGLEVSEEEIYHARLSIGTIINGGISTLKFDARSDAQKSPSLLSRLRKWCSGD